MPFPFSLPEALFAGAAVSTAGFLLLWPVSLRLRDSAVADLWWGPGFAGFVFTAWAVGGAPGGAIPAAILGLVTLWAARMAWTLGGRRRRAGGEEDPRYAALRAAAGPSWPLRSLFQVFLLQAAVQSLLALPAASAALSGAAQGASGFGPLAALGVMVALCGLALETRADQELDRWRARGGGGLMRHGLRARVRHPNYAGEILFWAGIAMIAVSAGIVWAPLAPLGLALLLDRVSGRPPLEERLARHPDWAAYAASVPPWAPRGLLRPSGIDRTGAGGPRP